MTQVVYYLDSQGNNPIKDFINSLPKSTQAKIFRIFLTIETYHLQSVLPHLKKLTGTPLWEIRILGKDSIRILYVTPTKEIDTAIKRYRQYLDE